MRSSSIIEKIRKLMNLARDKGATPDEAATAAAMAQKLMHKHQIEEADLAEKGEIQLDPISHELFYESGRTDAWIQNLASALAPAFCCIVLLRTGKGLILIGRPDNREAFKFTFNYLKDITHDMATKTCPKNVHGRRWSNSYGMGCSVKIYQRVKEERAALQAAAQAMDPNAIVLVKEDGLVKDYLKNEFKTKKANESQSSFDPNGYRQGYIDGDKVNLGSVPGRNQSTMLALPAAS
jgi:hypothetical protein